MTDIDQLRARFQRLDTHAQGPIRHFQHLPTGRYFLSQVLAKKGPVCPCCEKPSCKARVVKLHGPDIRSLVVRLYESDAAGSVGELLIQYSYGWAIGEARRKGVTRADIMTRVRDRGFQLIEGVFNEAEDFEENRDV